MSSKPLVIGNWKMSLTYKQTGELAMGLKKGAQPFESSVGVIIAPSTPYLDTVGKLLKGSQIQLAAQNVFWQAEGAYTGEVSAPMLLDLKCQYAIIGHSERRKYLRETDGMVHKKVGHALEHNMIPIICIGETFEQRQEGIKDLIVMKQLQNALNGIVPAENARVIIAYEPIWAVGTGQACDPNEAKETIQVLRHALIDMYQKHIAKNNFITIYGGSIDDTSIANYIDNEIIEGVLVGGASTKLDSYLGMIKAVAT